MQLYRLQTAPYVHITQLVFPASARLHAERGAPDPARVDVHAAGLDVVLHKAASRDLHAVFCIEKPRRILSERRGRDAEAEVGRPVNHNIAAVLRRMQPR